MAKKNSSGVFEKLEAEVVKNAGNYMKQNIKRRILKFSEMSLSFFLAFFFIFFGLSKLIGHYIPELATGWNFILLGISFLFIALLLKI